MRRVFPLIAQHLAALVRPVTVWSAACGSGEEAYSLAIMLERHAIDGRVLASDMNPKLVAAARKARYPFASISDTEDTDLRNWLVRKGDRWRPKRAVRERVTFSVATLGVDQPPDCDVVFARNVWRHMNPAQQERAAAQLADMLRPSGLLVVGGGDLLDAALRDATPPALRRHLRVSTEHDA